mmetsp:Transcript_2894/g.3403  ORF Transcript_2894/g.3403 Transcript_2894/m.3403 type:complete len:255 (+) Transcript_2894:44-808(+)
MVCLHPHISLSFLFLIAIASNNHECDAFQLPKLIIGGGGNNPSSSSRHRSSMYQSSTSIITTTNTSTNKFYKRHNALLISNNNSIRTKTTTIHHQKLKTELYGIDFASLQDGDECDFIQSDDFTQIDFSKCLPFPSRDIEPEDVVYLCMNAVVYNDEPKRNAGLEVCFNFSSDRCRAANGGTIENFVQHAANPTFQSMVYAKEWKTLSIGPEIKAGQHRGAMKTVLISVQPLNDELNERRFLWTLQKERRLHKL